MSKGSRGILKTGSSTDRRKRLSVTFRGDALDASLRESMTRHHHRSVQKKAQDRVEVGRRLTVALNGEGRTVLRIKPLANTPTASGSNVRLEDTNDDADDEMSKEPEQEQTETQEDGNDAEMPMDTGKQLDNSDDDDENNGDEDEDDDKPAKDENEEEEDDDEEEEEEEEEEQEEQEEAGTESVEPSRGRSQPKLASKEQVDAFLATVPLVPETGDAEEEGERGRRSSRRSASQESVRSSAPSPEARPPPALADDDRSRSSSPIPSPPRSPRAHQLPKRERRPIVPTDADFGLDLGMASLSLQVAHTSNEPADRAPTPELHNELDLAMSSLSLARESPRSAPNPVEQQDAGLDMGMASLSIAPPRPPRSPKRPPPQPVQSNVHADATSSNEPIVVITPPPAPSAQAAITSSSPAAVANPPPAAASEQRSAPRPSPPPLSTTLFRPSVLSVPTPVVSRILPVRAAVSRPPAPSAPAVASSALPVSVALPARHASPPAPPVTISLPVLSVPITPAPAFGSSARVSTSPRIAAPPSAPAFGQNPRVLQAPLPFFQRRAAPQAEAMDIATDDEAQMEVQEAWTSADSWNAPPMQLSSPPMVPAPPNTLQDIEMQDDAPLPSPQPAFTSQWPTAGVVPQPSPRPFVIQGQARPFAAQLQLQAVVPPHLSSNTFIPLGSVFHSGVPAPGDDVCVDMQTEEKRPNSVHRVPWTHRRGLAARDACQALAKDPSKKTFHLRARRRQNYTHYLPVIAPPQLGVAHACVLKIADRRKSWKSGSTVRTVFGPRCSGECVTARALLTKAGRKNHVTPQAQNNIPQVMPLALDVDVEMADVAPAQITPPTESAPLASTSAASQPVAAVADSRNFLDIAFMEDESGGVYDATNAHQGASAMVDKQAQAPTSHRHKWQSDARGTEEQARTDSTGKEQSPVVTAQESFTLDDMTALILGVEQTPQESPVEGGKIAGQGVAQVSATSSGTASRPASPKVAAEAPQPAAKTRVGQSVQVETTPLETNARSLGGSKPVSKSVSEASATSTPLFACLAPRRGTNTSSSVRLADATSASASPQPDASVRTESPLVDVATPAKPLEIADRSPAVPVSTVTTPKSAFALALDTQPVKKSTEPLAALPFSLRSSILSNAATPVSLPLAKVTPVAMPAPITLPAPMAAPAPIIPPASIADSPASSASAPVTDSTAAPSDSVSFYDFLSALPPVSRIPSPLEVSVPKAPDEPRKPFRLDIKLDPTSFQRYSAKPAALSPKPAVLSPMLHYYRPRAPTRNDFAPVHYVYRKPETPTEKDFDLEDYESALVEAIIEAELCPSPNAARSGRSPPTYNPETEDCGTPVMPGYFADLGASSDSDNSDGADAMSSFGSDDGDFEYGPDDQSSVSSTGSLNAVAMMAGGAGYLAGSAVKAVLVGVRRVAGWWSRRNKVQQ